MARVANGMLEERLVNFVCGRNQLKSHKTHMGKTLRRPQNNIKCKTYPNPQEPSAGLAPTRVQLTLIQPLPRPQA